MTGLSPLRQVLRRLAYGTVVCSIVVVYSHGYVE